MFEEKHNAEAQGLLRTRDGTDLASLADIVRWRMQSAEPLPMVEAARVVLDALQGLGGALPLFQTDPVGYAVPLQLEKTVTKPGRFFLGYNTTTGEARHHNFVTKSSVPRLLGLQTAWVTRASSRADLERMPYANWAIPRALAAALDFGPQLTFAEVPASPSVPAIPLPPSHYPSHELAVAPAPAAPAAWGSDDLQTLVNAIAEERKQGTRGAAPRVHRRWSSLFPGRALVSVQRINKLLKQAEAAGIKPEQPAAWASMVLPAGNRPASKFRSATGPRKAG